jgi:lactoylglutathione lyase
LDGPGRKPIKSRLSNRDNISIEILQMGKALEPAEPWASMANSGHW